MSIDWGVVANALGRGLEGGLQGYQFGKQLERQKAQDDEAKQFRDFQQREVTMQRLDRAGDRAQQGIQRQQAGEAAAREREAARQTALAMLGDDPITQRLPANFDPAQLDPIIKSLTAPKPDPYGGRTREQYMQDRRDEAGITHSFDRPPAPRAWAPSSMDEAVRFEQAKAGARGTDTPKSTEGERRAAALLGLVEQADTEIGRLGTGNQTFNALSRVPFGRNVAGSDARQREQAGTQYVTNLLYLLSGATASPAEIEANKKIYIPEPGDNEADLAQKAQARQQANESARRMAGLAATQQAPTSDRPAVTDILSKYGLTPKPGSRP